MRPATSFYAKAMLSREKGVRNTKKKACMAGELFVSL